MRKIRGRGPTLRKTLVVRQFGYAVYTVDAFGVRDLTEPDEEFTNFAIHSDFPDLIKEQEIWIDERLFEKEGLFYLANALTQLKQQAVGNTESRAYAVGLKVERMLRERLVGVKFRAGRPHQRIPARVYHGQYATLPDTQGPIIVWLIDGNLVRSLYKTDYTEGGHGYVYRWVPKGEIWIEHDLEPGEMPYIVAHEYMELRLMRDEGLEYDPAHEICSKVEFELRDGKGARPLLGPPARELTKEDLPRLAAPVVFEYVLKHHLKKK